MTTKDEQKLREKLTKLFKRVDVLIADGTTPKELANLIMSIVADCNQQELQSLYDEWYKSPDGTYDDVEPDTIQASIFSRLTEYAKPTTFRKQGGQNDNH